MEANAVGTETRGRRVDSTNITSAGRGRRSWHACASAQGQQETEAISGASRLRVAALTATGARLVRPYGVRLYLFRSWEGVAKFQDEADHPYAHGEGDPARDD
jgi:hypothetical protein